MGATSWVAFSAPRKSLFNGINYAWFNTHVTAYAAKDAEMLINFSSNQRCCFQFFLYFPQISKRSAFSELQNVN